MLIDSDEATRRMTKLIDIYSKHGYGEEVMFRMAVGYCIDIVKQMAGENNDDTRQVHSIHGKRVLRANCTK